MTTNLSDVQLRSLRSILVQGAEGASQALSRWIGEELRLNLGELAQLDPAEASDSLGPPDSLIAACAMRLTGALGGSILLCFDDRAGWALVDKLLGQPLGTTKEWGEVEKSAVLETTNILGCAYLNALAPLVAPASAPGAAGGLTPPPPAFLQEFAGSLLQFAMMDQALELDRVLLARTGYESAASGAQAAWTLLFIPDAPSLSRLASLLPESQHP